MADQETETLTDEVEEEQTNPEGEAQGEDLTGLKSTLSKLKTERTALKAQLAEQKQETTFFASLPAGVKNPRAARVLAQEFGHIGEDGTLDVEAFKAQFPEQFSNAIPPGNAGEGTQQPASSGNSMNEWIRHQAGIKR